MTLLSTVFHFMRAYPDDDCTDQLNHTVTSSVLFFVMFLFLIHKFSVYQVHCLTPKRTPCSSFPNPDAYVESICQNKNIIPLNTSQIEISGVETNAPPRHFLQSSVLVFFIFIISYRLPSLFWRSSYRAHGIDIRLFLEVAGLLYETDNQDFRRRCRNIMLHMFEWFLKKRFLFRIKLFPYYLTFKIMSIFTVAAQLVFTTLVLHNHRPFNIYKFFSKDPFESTKNLPFVIFCSFFVRDIGQPPVKYNFQCLVPLNYYFELFFALYWLWLVMLIIANTLNLAQWLWNVLSLPTCLSYARQNILEALCEVIDEEILLRFVSQYLSFDGIVIMRLVESNFDDLMMSDLMSDMYYRFNSGKVTLEAEGKRTSHTLPSARLEE